MAEKLKVSSSSDPSATAGALANTIREEGVAELQAIGPKAVNQAVKAITIARGYMAPSGVDLVFLPAFVDVSIDQETKTAIRMKVETRLPFTPRNAGREDEEQTEADSSRSEEEQGGKSQAEENGPNENEVQSEDKGDILDI